MHSGDFLPVDVVVVNQRLQRLTWTQTVCCGDGVMSGGAQGEMRVQEER